MLIRLGLFAAAAISIILRNPGLIQYPRFWGEEGLVFFQHAYNSRSIISGLTTSHGYYSLPPAIATTLAANMFQVETAPLITTIVAFLIQLMPLGIVCFSHSAIYRNPLDRLIFSSIIILVIPGNEVWLTTIASQFHLTIAACLILMEDPEEMTALRAHLYLSIIVFAGLSGILVCSLLPLFVLKWFRTRNKISLAFAGCLFAVTLIQILVTIAEWNANPALFHSRMQDKDLFNLVAITWNRNFLMLFLNQDQSLLFGRLFYNLRHSVEDIKLLLIMIPVFLVFIAVYCSIFFLWTKRTPQFSWLAFLWLNLITFYGSIDPSMSHLYSYAGARYYYPTNILILFSLYLWIREVKFPGKLLKQLAILVFLAAGLLRGADEFGKEKSLFTQLPKWTDEVRLWRRNPEHKLRIWPSPWAITLQQKRPTRDVME